MIRSACGSDMQAVYLLMNELEETCLNSTLFEAVYQENLMNSNITYLVYEQEGKVLGFISMHIQKLLHHTGSIAEIQELVVTQLVRSEGIGKKLFQAAKQIAIQKQCQQLEVSCNQKRTSSHRFYQSCGLANQHFKFTLPL